MAPLPSAHAHSPAWPPFSVCPEAASPQQSCKGQRHQGRACGHGNWKVKVPPPEEGACLWCSFLIEPENCRRARMEWNCGLACLVPCPVQSPGGQAQAQADGQVKSGGDTVASKGVCASSCLGPGLKLWGKTHLGLSLLV